MIVTCTRGCGARFDDEYRTTICPHETFAANDGNNNFAHHPEAYLSVATPAPAKALRALVHKWREEVRKRDKAPGVSAGVSLAYGLCADELDAALTAAGTDTGTNKDGDSLREAPVSASTAGAPAAAPGTFEVRRDLGERSLDDALAWEQLGKLEQELEPFCDVCGVRHDPNALHRAAAPAPKTPTPQIPPPNYSGEPQPHPGDCVCYECCLKAYANCGPEELRAETPASARLDAPLDVLIEVMEQQISKTFREYDGKPPCEIVKKYARRAVREAAPSASGGLDVSGLLELAHEWDHPCKTRTAEQRKCADELRAALRQAQGDGK